MSERATSKSENLPMMMVQRLIALSLVVGIIGGAGGGYIAAKYGIKKTTVDRHELVVQESSAVIDVAKKVAPSVVSITSKTTSYNFFGMGQTQEGAGTGIIISSDGLIITNKHVVDGQDSNYTVITSDGKEYKDAKVIARDSVNDLAFVKIDAKGLKAADLGDSASMQVGQQVVAIGNALGQFQNSVTTGVISGLSRPITAGDGAGSSEDLQNLFQTDAAINPGNSGGPLVNLEGQVIGINTAVAGNAQNIGFAIPINEAKTVIASVKDKGKISRPYLGVRYALITKDFATRNNLKATDGAYVVGDSQNLAVIPNSPASKAGVQSGDIITKIAGDKIDASHSPSSLVSKHKVGDKVDLEVIRDGQTKTLTATLEEAPSL